MSLSISEQLDSIFDVPKNGANIKEEDTDNNDAAYAEVVATHDNASFDQKVKALSEKLAKDVPSSDVPNTSTVEASYVQPTFAAPEQPKQSTEDEFQTILSRSVQPKQPIVAPVQPLVQEPIFDTKDTKREEPAKNDDTIRNNDKPIPVALEGNAVNDDSVSESVSDGPSSPVYNLQVNSDGWLLTAPAPMYSHFYTEKAAFIRHITVNGKPLEIDKLTTELRNSSVSTKVELTDLPGMAERLTKIQDFLDRVVQIKVQATSQCAATKRGVELLRGVLAKVSYEKPAARQDGVIYDHMRDIEMYASRVESLEQNAKDIYHNLLEAKEILSRKISIAIELVKEQNKTDGLEKSFNNLPDSSKKTMSAPIATSSKLAGEGYDRLDVQEAVVKAAAPKQDRSIKKSGQSDWMD